MAFNSKIRLEIISALNDAGIKATADQLDQLQNKVTNAQAATQGLGKQFSSAFNPMEAIMAVAHGNVEGITKSMVQLGLAVKNVTVSVGMMTGIFGGITLAVMLVKKLVEHFRGVEESAKKAAEEEEKLNKAALESGKSIETAYKSATAAVDEWGKKRSAEITLTKNAERAELELAATRAKAAGDSKKYEELTAKAKDVEIEKTRLLGATELEIAKRKYDAAKKQTYGLKQYDDRGKLIYPKNGGEFTFNAKGWELQRRRLNGQIGNLERQIKEANAGTVMQSSAGAFVMKQDTTELEAQLKEAKAARVKLREDMVKAKTAAGLVAEAKRNLEIESKTKAVEIKKEEAKVVLQAAAEAERLKTETAAIIKAEQDERRKMQEELHRQRLADTESEMNVLQRGLSAAKSRFDREFKMYKSGDAAQQIEAEKADEEARKKLARDAELYNRFDSKGRIGKLAELYASGDEDAVKKKLSEWRKDRGFTPEVEAMVRAAAAGKTVKTMEDRVAEIADNTKGLADKVDELLSMKGGE